MPSIQKYQRVEEDEKREESEGKEERKRRPWCWRETTWASPHLKGGEESEKRKESEGKKEREKTERPGGGGVGPP